METYLQIRSQPVSQGDGHLRVSGVFLRGPLLPAPWCKPRLRDLDDAFPLPAVLFPAGRRRRACSVSVVCPLSTRPLCWLGSSFSLCLGFSGIGLRVSPLGVTELLGVWVDFPCLSNWEKNQPVFLGMFRCLILLSGPSHTPDSCMLDTCY